MTDLRAEMMCGSSMAIMIDGCVRAVSIYSRKDMLHVLLATCNPPINAEVQDTTRARSLVQCSSPIP